MQHGQQMFYEGHLENLFNNSVCLKK